MKMMSLPPPSAASSIDPIVHAAWARVVASLAPESIMQAWLDWGAHLASSPGKRIDLAQLALSQAGQMGAYLRDCLVAGPGAARACVEPPARDHRFAAPEWRQWPFNLLHQSFLLQEQWWDAAAHGVWGVDKHHEDVVAFMMRQWLDMFSPGNLLATNPLVLKRTVAEGGGNLLRGAGVLAAKLQQMATEAPPRGTEDFVVGRDVAITPGKVVLKNRLIELIQYSPATPQVHPEPILIVPAWIMKYYILDLSPQNSLIRYLVGQGHTVFCISWKNPTGEDRDLGMDDYLELGFHAALGAVNAIVPQRKVHATGYCLGGTLVSIAAAAMARDGDARLASLSLFATQTDFSEPGELGLFIDEGQISLLEAQMAQTGYLTGAQMGGAFQMLRSYDLLWSRLVNDYLLGTPAQMNDLMAWNADTTRMPAKMHSQYLRRLFLNDDLSEGRYPVGGKPVALNDIALPLFCVGTAADHVAPWRSVYKLHHEAVTEITFVLTSGGHNAGIVSEPEHPHRHYQMQTRPFGAAYVAPDAWAAAAPQFEGSWWPAWTAWLRARSEAPQQAPRMGAAALGYPLLGDAPGAYVMEK
ncbi:PHA/PHB synthase family protein [Janthinobacterium fluminis]|uniref:Alpha/beta fold hydrolase n=1 Tax=Janthinobacterium fluminis TaxID=2987524 RepID=A0ABT5K128_9BURK|nr:alpha/beta fold hydrolase [Janthinobacterium fluminis]MDC8758660.1 alpha/beta fold hydrolase [Janthinobacterium fluminis]